MTTPDELVTIFDRIRDGIQNDGDILLLRQWLKNSDGHNVLQVGKNIINIADGKDIHIGDRTYYNTDAQTIKAVIQEVFKDLISSLNIEKLPQENSAQANLLARTKKKDLVTKTNLQNEKNPTSGIPAITKFEFEVVTLDIQGIETKLCLKQADYFIENLPDDFILEMVSIAGGKFQMGAPQDEPESLEDERPQHIVTLKPFFLSKYPITQAQWRIIANLPKINRRLEVEPSCFKGDNLPVERVSWDDAQEFCERLSRATGRKYRLLSEAEWEYACRAKTSTPFHFGKTITPNLAKYFVQNENINSISPQQTIEVGSFLPNAFGIYDMHGLVWEWCEDCEHEDYQDAPSDGSSWVNNGNSEYRILRGGSWDSPAHLCRSASRFSEMASVTDSRFGFRVVCSSI
ncbi:MAG: SUMF1/EgtB/PvdO family nonheme iron enzyme [Nostoc sp. ChiSLP02]|nr:SUMF1/EgtB/PvdO family nonheme iron enzyme [Nostoc sp. DedSLP05]MDZ8098990.1 SUMF1/EgtB/PvdO family nonheme iron enzyme [Nostoc sp. DedSLP01]MDZ8185834.1 SUMF1/EgtB/PvdO family nonheme iron enzyme [Nostoc sp. ChiSLP02]